MSMLFMLPIVFIFLIVFILYKASTKITSFNKITNKIKMLIVSCYLLLLAVFIIGMYIYSVSLGIVKTSGNKYDNEKTINEYKSIRKYAIEGRLDLINDRYLLASEKFNFNKKKIDFWTGDNSGSVFLNASNKFIFVEEKEQDDNIIECNIYSAPIYLDEMDITRRLKHVRMDLKGDALDIKLFHKENESSKKRYNLYYFNCELPLIQVNKSFEYKFEDHSSPSIIYVKLPKGTEVGQPKGNVQYVNKVFK